MKRLVILIGVFGILTILGGGVNTTIAAPIITSHIWVCDNWDDHWLPHSFPYLGNGDGVLNPGEDVELWLYLENTGDVDAFVSSACVSYIGPDLGSGASWYWQFEDPMGGDLAVGWNNLFGVGGLTVPMDYPYAYIQMAVEVGYCDLQNEYCCTEYIDIPCVPLTVVPEPASIVFLGMGVIAMAAMRKKKFYAGQ